MTFNKVMTVAELLRWAFEETQFAEGLERLLPDMPEEVQTVIKAQAKVHRERSRWLDQQVAFHLDRADEEGSRRRE